MWTQRKLQNCSLRTEITLTNGISLKKGHLFLDNTSKFTKTLLSNTNLDKNELITDEIFWQKHDMCVIAKTCDI